MKKYLAVAAVALVLSAFSVLSGLDNVIGGIKAGNASAVAKYFDNTVEISLPGKSNSYSKSQGEVVLRDFFSNNPVRSFTIIHRGESAGSQFCIGTLVTANGSFRTTVNLRRKGDSDALQEIKFEN